MVSKVTSEGVSTKRRRRDVTGSRLSNAGVWWGRPFEEVRKGGLNDRDQEVERSRLSDVRRLRSPLRCPGGPGSDQPREDAGACDTHVC